MELTPEQKQRANADTIRYTLAGHIEHAIQGWKGMRIAYHDGEIGGYVVEDETGRQYEVRLTVTPKGVT